MRSGGTANLWKGAEIAIVQSLEKGLEDLLVVSALGIWAAEADWSVFQGYESGHGGTSNGVTSAKDRPQ